MVRLPLVGADPPAALSDASDERHAGKLAGLRILVVEDADDVRDALRLTLEALGAGVSVARDGLEALEAIASSPPDAVLCDLQMPRMDGFEFLERLHADAGGPHPPVIAITGPGRGMRRRRTAGAGFAAHLDKPVDQQALIRAIEMATLPH
jgi:CheY-like chemotaxis protein